MTVGGAGWQLVVTLDLQYGEISSFTCVGMAEMPKEMDILNF